MKKESKSDIINPQPNTKAYIVAVVLIVLIAIASIVSIDIVNPDKDNTLIIAAILGFITPTIASIFSFIKAQETHLMVNSRLSQFMENAEIAATAKGKEEGRLAANERTDALSKAASEKLVRKE